MIETTKAPSKKKPSATRRRSPVGQSKSSGPRSLVAGSRSKAAVIEKIREGLDVKVVGKLAVLIGVSEKRVSETVGIPVRTLNRRKKQGRLTSGESDRVYRVDRVFRKAVDVLGGEDRAREWFRTPQVGLGGDVPLEYCDTEPGAEEVFDLLGRIEHGVFS